MAIRKKHVAIKYTVIQVVKFYHFMFMDDSIPFTKILPSPVFHTKQQAYQRLKKMLEAQELTDNGNFRHI